MSYCLRDDVPGLKIKQKGKEHDPASSGEGTIPQIDALVMLFNINFSHGIKLMWTQIDHCLPSDWRAELN
jgi:hypothetical protein